jgi:protein SCO1
MATVNRRGMVAAALPLAGVMLGSKVAEADERSEHEHAVPTGPNGERIWAKTSSREILQARYFPNVVLTSQDERKVHFYDDLLRDKVVMINMMYTRCRGICPGVTANLVRVQKELGAKVGREVFMYSISLRPEEDTPAALSAYAKMHHVQPGWSFFTGAAADIERLRRSLGYADPDPKVDADKLQHTGVIVYGNEARELWASCPAMGDPAWIVETLGFVMNT